LVVSIPHGGDPHSHSECGTSWAEASTEEAEGGEVSAGPTDLGSVKPILVERPGPESDDGSRRPAFRPPDIRAVKDVEVQRLQGSLQSSHFTVDDRGALFQFCDTALEMLNLPAKTPSLRFSASDRSLQPSHAVGLVAVRFGRADEPTEPVEVRGIGQVSALLWCRRTLSLSNMCSQTGLQGCSVAATHGAALDSAH